MKAQMKALMLGSMLLWTMPALAQQPAPEAASAVPGADTRSWLDLQTSGAASVPEVQPVVGEVAGQVYQRYVDSFKYAIPQTFPREGFKSQSGGGGK